ncbi:MAG TPA: Gfo/Idh/MocA family oxidoreductase [Candidatus Omnitrophota bacterium]|jgi:predicted dehydrogenase|nr:Gfo/Idh/MocA family oxidoreductase [Candidatus Omnitrophota bacterium]
MMHVGVIGCGYWGPNLVRNLLSNRKCDGVTVCDASTSNLERARERFPHLRCVGSVEELLADRLVESVLIATPVSTHYPLARACIESGRHTFVEKPLTASVAEAEELIDLADRYGVTLMVGHTFEFSPPVVKIKQIIESGTLGDIFYVSAIRVNLGIHQKDVSVVWDLAPHDLSMLFYWLDEAPSAVAMMGGAYVRPGISDVAFVNLQFASGTIANLQVSWLSPSKLRQTTIVGSQKMLIYDDTNAMERVKVFDRGVEFLEPTTFNEYTLTYRTGDIVSPAIPTTEPLQLEIDHFLECAMSGDRPRTDGLSGLRVVRVLEAIERSGKNGNRLEKILPDGAVSPVDPLEMARARKLVGARHGNGNGNGHGNGNGSGRIDTR